MAKLFSHDGTTAGKKENSATAAAPLSQPLANVNEVSSWVVDYETDIDVDPLHDVNALKARLDLTRANPNGKSRLLSSGHATVGSLFRDSTMLSAAERDLGHVYAQMQTNHITYGYASISLIAGVATWKNKHIPVLIYPLYVEHNDNERFARAQLCIWERPYLNPELVAAFREEGAAFNPYDLLKACEYADGVINQKMVLEKVDAYGSQRINNFTVERQYIVGCFINSATLIARQATTILHRLEAGPTGVPLIDAIAGDEKAARLLAPRKSDMDRDDIDDDPHDEFEVGDVSNAVRRAARLAANGHSVFVDASANMESAHAALAIASRCIAQGKTVLYTPCVGTQKEEFIRAAHDTGISSLILDTNDLHYRHAIDNVLVDSLRGSNSQAITHFNQIADELVGVRSRLARYFGDLHAIAQPWGVSAYQTIEELASIAALPTHPSNRIRLGSQTARALKDHLDDWSKKLIEAGELGEFTVEPGDTPWYSASIFTDEDAKDTYQRVTRLLDVSLPKIQQQITSTEEKCGFPTPITIEEWGRQVSVLQNLRRTLDVFKPEIFSRDITAMLDATMTKEAREDVHIDMGYWERRRYIKEIRSLIRPGQHVEDLHSALIIVRRDAKIWKSMSSLDGWPTLPDQLDQIIETFESVMSDITALDSVLATTPEGPGLSGAAFEMLTDRLQRLHDDKKALENLPARARLEREFKKIGLTPLINDLSARHIRSENAPDELRLAWWTTVFELIVRSSQMIANQDGELLANTTERFVELDLEHIRSICPLLTKELSKRLAEALYSHSQEANQLHTQLSGDVAPSLSALLREHPELIHAAKPILIGSPANLAASFSNERLADVVIVDACSHAPSAEVLSVLSYAPISVIIADKNFISSPIIDAASRYLQNINIPRDLAPTNAYLTQFLEQHGYQTESLPPSNLLNLHAHFYHIDAKGVPMHGSGLVDTTSDEVALVLNLIKKRAESFGQYRVPSTYHLSVVTLTRSHAAQISEALNHLAVRNTQIASLLPQVCVADISNVAGMPAGDLILSTSFAKTVHGKLLQQFGIIDTNEGDKLLLNALALAKGNCSIVAGFTSHDLEDQRLVHAGSRLLRDLLQWAEQLTNAPVPLVAHSGARGELLTDLAMRLQNRGYTTALNYGYTEGRKLPLAVGTAQHSYNLTVFTDDAYFMSIPSLRTRHRFLPMNLAKAGWYAAHVWSVGLFVDPEKEIDRILSQISSHTEAPSQAKEEISSNQTPGLRQFFAES